MDEIKLESKFTNELNNEIHLSIELIKEEERENEFEGVKIVLSSVNSISENMITFKEAQYLCKYLSAFLEEYSKINNESNNFNEDKYEDVSFNGSSLYPRIFVGESSKPLSTGVFPETEVGDDNVTNTWRGLLSYYG